MAITKQVKQEQLAELIEKFKTAKSVVFAQNKGLTVPETQELRGILREKNADMKIAKKTLMVLAAKEAGYENIPTEIMEGAISAVFSYEDVVAGAKTIYEYAKKHDALALLGALLDGKIMGTSEAKELASLPSKEELIAKLIYLLKSPISGFHGVLHGTMSSFVRALDAISKKS